MAQFRSVSELTRKTRIVCISDTHNQTPKLPKGDVLIHAGDLTNQGSYSELKKVVEWLEKADFEAKIVIAGNHDITLDAPFYEQHGSSWRWPQKQDPIQCRKLLTESQSITYLEHDSTTIYLSSEKGPHTCFKVFGSPYTPKKWNWAFQYDPEYAQTLWDDIPPDSDIVITHTPPQGHCDKATKDDRSGCESLLRTLHQVCPMMCVFGHIHSGRGVQRVHWNHSHAENDSLEQNVEVWEDPGIGNKQSQLDLTAKGGRPLNNFSTMSSLNERGVEGHESDGLGAAQPGSLKSTSQPADSEAVRRAKLGSTNASRQDGLHSDIGLEIVRPDVDGLERRRDGLETAMINAAFLGPHQNRGPKVVNKPIIVDVDLPVWYLEYER